MVDDTIAQRAYVKEISNALPEFKDRKLSQAVEGAK